MSNNVTPLLAALREQKAMRLKGDGGVYVVQYIHNLIMLF
jgi:hypothetical protein